MATQDWHYFVDNVQHGPVTAEDLRQLAAAGTISKDTELWKSDWPARRLASELKGLFPAAAVGSPPPPSRRPPEAVRNAAKAADDVTKKLWFLDLKFEQFATPRLIGFLFTASLLLLITIGVGSIAYGFFTQPLLKVIFGAVVILIWLVVMAVGLRVFFEGCLIMFRATEHLSNLRHLKPQDDEMI